MKTQIIRLESHDDYISIREKMSWSKARRILLVFPRRRPPVLQRLDLILVQRQAQALGGQVGLVTQDNQIIIEAKELGIPVFSTIPTAQRTGWQSLNRRRKSLRIRPRQKNDPQVLRELLSKTRPSPEKGWVRATSFFLGMASFVALMLFFLPSATIFIKPYQEEQRIEMRVRASPRIEVVSPSGLLPAEVQRITLGGTLWGDTTGTQRIGDEKASGTVQLINLTNEAVLVPQGTLIRTLSEPPVQYELTQDVMLPAGYGQSLQAGVRALLPGSHGNVPPMDLGTIEGNLGLVVAVQNSTAIFGGSDRQGRVVSESDVARLYDMLITSLGEDALHEMQKNLPAGKVIIPETLTIHQIIKKSYQPQIGELADQFVLNLEVEFEAWVYDELQLERVVRDAMNAQLSGEMMVVEDTLQIRRREGSLFVPGQLIEFTVEASRMIKEKIEPASLTASIRGQPIETALSSIVQQYRLGGLPEIDIRPKWWTRLPFLPFRIFVEEG